VNQGSTVNYYLVVFLLLIIAIRKKVVTDLSHIRDIFDALDKVRKEKNDEEK
jgi:hypothetical protein